MQSTIRLLVIVTIVELSPSQSFSAELWTYQFTPTGSRPYNVSCGECASPYADSRADVAGTFTILLNWQNATGKLFELNDHLVNVAYVLYTHSPPGTIMQPANPPDRVYGIVPPYHTTLFADGHFTYTNGLGHLTSDGRLPGGGYAYGLPYDIWFTLNAATFNMTVPIIDYWITVSGAFAAFATASIAGDFNHDSRVDTRDYILWRKSASSAADYDLWRMSFGTGSPATATQSAPEPSSILLAISAAALLLKSRGRRSS